MIKKLAKNIFLVFEFFTNSWTLSGKRWRHGTDEEWGGFSEGWKLQMEKYSPYPVLCKRSQLGPVRSSSVCSTWLLLGAADAWQMAGLCAVRFQLLFFFSNFGFSSNMIVSSPVHTWQNRVPPLRCPQIQFLPFTYVFFLQYSLFWICVLRKSTWNWKPEKWGQLKRFCRFWDVACAASSKSLTLNVYCVFYCIC